MMPLTQQDVMPLTEYERVRNDLRARIIELKRRRRISVGDKLSLVFENRDTVLFQIHEMIRTEYIVAPDKIQDELDVYNALLPQRGELSATLFIEIPDSYYIQRDLELFRGIDHGQTVGIVVGCDRVYGEFEGGHSHQDKISAVHFVKFRPSSQWMDSLRTGAHPTSIIVDHEQYRHEAAVPPELRQEWLHDLGVDDMADVRLTR